MTPSTGKEFDALALGDDIASCVRAAEQAIHDYSINALDLTYFDDEDNAEYTVTAPERMESFLRYFDDLSETVSKLPPDLSQEVLFSLSETMRILLGGQLHHVFHRQNGPKARCGRSKCDYRNPPF